MPNLQITRDVIFRMSFRPEGHPKNKDVGKHVYDTYPLIYGVFKQENIRVYTINYQGGTLVIRLWMNYGSFVSFWVI
jgi:hypothetical protein